LIEFAPLYVCVDCVLNETKNCQVINGQSELGMVIFFYDLTNLTQIQYEISRLELKGMTG
jgi:hypothetical protein